MESFRPFCRVWDFSACRWPERDTVDRVMELVSPSKPGPDRLTYKAWRATGVRGLDVLDASLS
eukprot:10948395-Lingulodinium_polyedra.AAC.1